MITMKNKIYSYILIFVFLCSCGKQKEIMNNVSGIIKPKTLLDINNINEDDLIKSTAKLYILNIILEDDLNKIFSNKREYETSNLLQIIKNNCRLINNYEVYLHNYDSISISLFEITDISLFKNRFKVFNCVASFKTMTLNENKICFLGIDSSNQIFNLSSINLYDFNNIVKQYSNNIITTNYYLYQLCKFYSKLKFNLNFGIFKSDSIQKPTNYELENMIRETDKYYKIKGNLIGHYKDEIYEIEFLFNKNYQLVKEPKLDYCDDKNK